MSRPSAPLTATQRDRYKRHLLLPEVGGQGQRALLGASVLVVGAGALGVPILTALAGAGVGRIAVCDGDRVEASNLHRQTLFRTSDIGAPKAAVAAKRLADLNPDVEWSVHDEYLDEDNADRLVSSHNLVAEGLDRYAPRYTVNAACLRARRPLVSAGVRRFDGQVAALAPGRAGAPCYACLVPEAPDDEAVCETEGVLGAVTGVIGNLAALTAIRHLTGDEEPLGRLTLYDGLAGTMRTVRLPRDPACPVCGDPR